MRDITVKDVLYALEYMHDAMVRTPPQTMGGKAKWTMKATGATVKEAVANEVRSSGSVTSLDDRDGRQLIVWRAVA
jgi:hypothetical protein